MDKQGWYHAPCCPEFCRIYVIIWRYNDRMTTLSTNGEFLHIMLYQMPKSDEQLWFLYTVRMIWMISTYIQLYWRTSMLSEHWAIMTLQFSHPTCIDKPIANICIIWIFKFFANGYHFHNINIKSGLLSLTNEVKFEASYYQINLLMLVNLLMLSIKFLFICDGQQCRIRLFMHTYIYFWNQFSLCV